MAVTGNMSQGAKLALGIVLLWFGGLCLFVAFMSGKASSLITGVQVDAKGNAVKDAQGNQKTEGPRDASELMTQLADTMQQAGTYNTMSTKGAK